MSYMIKAPAKINLGLDVIRRRPDGYHELKMIMQTITLYDELEIDIISDSESVMTCDNSDLPVNDDNLVMKAVKLMKDNFNITQNYSIKLTKNIPVAAGMAGGSTDAAACMLAINEISGVNAPEEKLRELAVTIGADIPYCIMKGTALSEGIGEILTKLDPFDDCFILIVKPPIEVSTGFVYKNLVIRDEDHPDIDKVIESMSNNNLEAMDKVIGNILETVTIPAYPVIDEIKKSMKDKGAKVSLMSGSGPTVFGLFDNENDAFNAKELIQKEFDGSFAYVARPCKE